MLTMVLATAEYDFILEYCEGVKNVLADFGTRQLNPDDFIEPVNPDDPLELNSLFTFSAFTPSILNIPTIKMSDYEVQDFEELDYFKLESKEEEDVIKIKHRNDWFNLIPAKLRRAFFWSHHFHRHEGVTYMVESLKTAGYYFPDMTDTLLKFLGQCACVTAKDQKPPAYQTDKQIFATAPLQLVSFDLFAYDDMQYLTIMDIFSKLPFVFKCADKKAETIASLYSNWVSMYDEPEKVLCDNGTEFNSIPSKKLTTPSCHPQGNSVLERFHKELAVMSRVHNTTPDIAVQFLRTQQSKLLFYSALKMNFTEPTICSFQYEGRQFNKDELVWRHVEKRSKKKSDKVFSGPHRVLERLGDFTYMVTTDKSAFFNKTMKLNLNDIKKFIIPDTRDWALNVNYLEKAKMELACNNTAKDIIIDFLGLETITLDNISNDFSEKLIVVPDWPCMYWYRPLHDCVVAEAVLLPREPDLFIDSNGNPLEKFAWDNWLFYIKS